MKRLLWILLPCIFLLASCKKDEEVTTKPYLNGQVILGYPPEFISADETVVYRPRGVTHPKNRAIGLYYTISSFMPEKDTVYYADPPQGKPGPLPPDYKDVEVPVDFGEYTALCPDTLGTFTLTFTIYAIDAGNYNSLYSYRTATIVDEDRSIPRIICNNDDYPVITALNYPGKEIYVDTRDAEERYYAEIPVGGQTWMSRNMYSSVDSTGAPYAKVTAFKDCGIMGYIFGGFYNWQQAQTVCPKGWKLPSLEDFDSLWSGAGCLAKALFSPAEFNTSTMWEYWPAVGEPSNSTLFSAIPVGYVNLPANQYSGLGYYAAFWASDEDRDSGAYVYFSAKDNAMMKAYAHKTDMGMSVRCVRK